jgi:hypothetical protein
MPALRFDEAFDILVARLATLPTAAMQTSRQAGNPDFEVRAVLATYSQSRAPGDQLAEDDHPIFYDAAWELARIGVIRPGRHNFSRNHFGGGGFDGATFSITEFGRRWLQDAASRAIGDPSRWTQVLQNFAARFGAGYAQRAAEAVGTYRTGNYLAACVMAGAAAESILLAVAIAKSGNEASVLANYNRSGGRQAVLTSITGQLTASVRAQFTSVMHVLHYWRDDAAHGMATTISEIEAFASISQLLRLAQFCDDHWSDLTR